ncbi:MAG: hypothetical protein WDO15_28830 [Bacteroidota bacterium]
MNHLTTRHAQYTEVGYAIEGIARIFRVEGAMGFQNTDFKNANFGFRVGIASSIVVNFND